MDELQSNIFYRTAQAALERSETRRGQMTDLTDSVRALLTPVPPAEIGKQIAQLNEAIGTGNPGQARFNPDRIVTVIESGEPVHFGLNQADLKALFGPKAPFLEKDLVIITLKKQKDGPLVEIKTPTLVNKTAYP
jgi:hypothetical protein